MYKNVKPGKVWYFVIAVVFITSVVVGSIFIAQGFKAITSIDTKEIGEEFNIEVLDDNIFQFYLDLQGGELVSVDLNGAEVEVIVDHAGISENESYIFTIEYQGSEEKLFTVYDSEISTEINGLELVFSIEL